MLLEKILEEDSTCSVADDYSRRDMISPNGNDKRYLLGNGHTTHHIGNNMVNI